MKTQELLEKKFTAPEWAAREQEEFRKFISQFGFRLTTLKPQKSNLIGDINVGGALKDKDDNEFLDKDLRLQALKKGLARYLLDKAKEGRFVKIFYNNYWRHDPRYIHPEDDVRAAEHAVDNAVRFQTDRYDSNKKYLNIYWSISEPK